MSYRICEIMNLSFSMFKFFIVKVSIIWELVSSMEINYGPNAGQICKITKKQIKSFKNCKFSIINGILYGSISVISLCDKIIFEDFSKRPKSIAGAEIGLLHFKEITINTIVNGVCFVSESRGMFLVPLIMTLSIFIVVVAYLVTALYVLNKKWFYYP